MKETAAFFHLLGQKTKNSACNSLISDHILGHFWVQRPNFWQFGKTGTGESRDESGDRESMGGGVLAVRISDKFFTLLIWASC
jgi:hypothetical protein